MSHSKVSNISRYYIKVEDKGFLNNNKEELLFDNNVDEYLFGETESNFKIEASLKKSVKNKVIKLKSKNSFYNNLFNLI